MTGVHLHPPRRHEITTGDPAVVQDFLSQSYGTTVLVEHPGAGSSELDYSHGRTGVGLFAVETITARGTVRTRAERLAPAVVYLPRDGQIECRTADETSGAGPGQLLLAQCTDGALHTCTTDATLDTVVLDQTLLIDAAAVGGDVIRFTGHVPEDQAAAALFTKTARFIATNVLNDPVRATPLVLGAAGRLLASAALTAFANSAATDEAETEEAAPVTLRRAIDFIEANAHNDIGIADIAGSIYLTPRSVQYIFRRHLDTTPTDFLRHVRLARARADLRGADRSITTVAAVAARWGFAHTGRFAVQYRQTFGESPHETLRTDY
jgi:AraC-like DNA-binding protein